MDEIRNIVQTLRRSLTDRNSESVIIKTELGEHFLNILQKEGFIKVQRNNEKTELYPLVLSDLYIVDRVTIRAREILHYASEELPTITGIVIVSTNRGIMTHISAEEQNLGGRVIAHVY